MSRPSGMAHYGMLALFDTLSDSSAATGVMWLLTAISRPTTNRRGSRSSSCRGGVLHDAGLWVNASRSATTRASPGSCDLSPEAALLDRGPQKVGAAVTCFYAALHDLPFLAPSPTRSTRQKEQRLRCQCSVVPPRGGWTCAGTVVPYADGVESGPRDNSQARLARCGSICRSAVGCGSSNGSTSMKPANTIPSVVANRSPVHQPRCRAHLASGCSAIRAAPRTAAAITPVPRSITN